MSNSPSESVSDEHSCGGLCFTYLDVLSVDVRRDTRRLVHELWMADVKDESAKERCTQVVIKIERELGPEHFICELVMDALTGSLRKISMLDCAVELINEHMERKKSQDVGSLVLLAQLQAFSGVHRKALEHLAEAYQLAEQSGEPLLLSLVLVKEACNHWYLKEPEEVKRNVALCERTLEESGAEEQYNTFPFTHNTYRLMDIFKTLGYIHQLLGDQQTSLHYNLKVLNILEKDEKSVIKIIKQESRVAKSYVKIDREQTQLRSKNVLKNLKTVSSNEVYMTQHPLPMIRCFSSVAFSMLSISYKEEALEAYEYAYNLAKKYLGPNHPEVARIAASTAYLCNQIQMFEKEKFYVQQTLAALEEGCVDLTFIKLHVQELTDAWKQLGTLFSNEEKFEDSEKCLKAAISINNRVYGYSHPRLTQVYRIMGFMYKRNHQYDLALHCFQESLEICRSSSYVEDKFKGGLVQEIGKLKALQEKKRTFSTGK